MRVGFRWPDGDGLGGGRIDGDSARADGDDASTEIRPLGDTHQAARPDAEFQHAQHMPFIHAYAGDPHILPHRAFFQRPLACGIEANARACAVTGLGAVSTAGFTIGIETGIMCRFPRM